jgi:N-methylhydantoinase B
MAQDAAPGAVEIEIIKSSLSGIVQEMQNSLFRTGYSTIVRESQDASCAIMDTQAQVIAQHVVLPLHMGAFPACCAAVMKAYGDEVADGDAFLINHPYEGGSPHAPDMAVLTPIFNDDRLIGYCGSIAHKSDIGGPVPGSCSGQARETFNEGLHLPAVRHVQRGSANAEIERIIAANSRTPELVLGDIRGQTGACRLGEQRVRQLIAKFGEAKSLRAFDRLLAITEERMKCAIAEWADGRFEAERFIDDDGIELHKPVRIHVVVEKRGDGIVLDFSGSADQTRGPANVRPPLVRAASAYVLISLVDPLIFINSGILRALAVRTREGSILNPRFPAAVNTYNATVHAMVEALFDALSHCVPARARADGCGSRSIIIGGRTTSAGKSYVQYEIVGGGAGGRASRDGASGTTVNQSNAKIAPIEIIECEFPTRVQRFELIRDSGGAGKFRGGLGLLREYVNLAEARFSIRSSKHVIPPRGVAGGKDGRCGDLTVNPDTSEAKHLPTRYADYPLRAGDIFRLETPGGGGLGNPFERDPASVLNDVVQGYVSPERAATDYGVAVVVTAQDWAIDHEATQNLRSRRASDFPPLFTGEVPSEARRRGDESPIKKTGH